MMLCHTSPTLLPRHNGNNHHHVYALLSVSSFSSILLILLLSCFSLKAVPLVSAKNIAHSLIRAFTGIFLVLLWGQISAPSQFKNEQKLPKNINSNFLVLHFGENFMKIWTKIAKLQMYENLQKKMWMKTCFHSHFYAFCPRFYKEQLKQQICYSFILLISHMVFNHLEWHSSSFRLHQIFPNLMVQMHFPQIQQLQ